MVTAGRPKGTPKTGGRIKGSLDKGQRQLITSEIAADILAVYRGLGGVAFLLDFAKENPGAFIAQCLSRLMPPMPRDDPEPVNQTLTINANMTDLEAATRIAYVLAKAGQGLEDQRTEPSPPVATRAPDQPDPDTVKVPPSPLHDPERERWAQDLQLSVEERRDQAVVRETHESNLADYAGSHAEQGRRRRRLL